MLERNSVNVHSYTLATARTTKVRTGSRKGDFGNFLKV